MTRRWWLWFLVLGLGVSAAAGFSGSSLAVGVASLLTGWVSVGIGISIVKRSPKETGRPWKFWVGAAIAFLVASLVRTIHGSITGVDRPFPSPADAIAFSGHTMLIIGGTMLGRLRAPDRNRSAVIDGAIIAAALETVVWVTLLYPYMTDGSVPLGDRAINGTYAMFTFVLLAVIGRLAVGPGARTLSYRLLAIACGITFLQDVLVTVETVGGPNATLGRALAPTIFVFFGAAALHPARLRIAEAPPAFDERLTWRRLAILTAALLINPAIVGIQLLTHRKPTLAVAAVSTAVITVLVLLRFVSLVRTQERSNTMQRILRDANADLAAASSRHLMNRSALHAVTRLAASADELRVSIAQVVDDELQIVDAEGFRADEAIGTSRSIPLLPRAFADALGALKPIDLTSVPPIDVPGGEDPEPAAVMVTPLVARNQLNGAIVVTSRSQLPYQVARQIESLTSTVSLALESAMLTEDLLRRRSERRFRALVENSSDIVLVVTGERRVTFASPAAQRLLGVPGDALLSSDPASWVHPDERALMISLLNRETADGWSDGTNNEVRIRHVDGSYRWFEVRTRDLHQDPEVQGVVVNAREITDRKAAEQLLGASEARFRALVQHSADVVAVVDERGRFTYVSPAITPMLGVTPDELIGTVATDLLPAEELYRMRLQAPQLAENRLPDRPVESIDLELQLRDKDGGLHTIDVTLTDLRHQPAVEGVVLNARDVTVRKALERDLRHQALHDALTGLANRAMFTERVDEALQAGDRRLLGALFIDLDDFKTVNDSLGHAVGDELLQRVAERLLTCLHPADVAARLGGDEFAVLVLSPWGEAGIVRIAERVLLALQAPFTVQSREIRISASIGIAIDADRTIDAEVLLRNADMAMYLAKDRGKNRFEVFEEGMHATVFERLELKADLARGIEDGQLRLLYQPIVSLQTGRITGVEALVRWEHPRRGLLSPDAFVPLAEDTGLIMPLGQWVLEEACQQLRAWQLSLPSTATLTMSVNLSVRQLQHEGIVREVTSTIDRFGLDPSTITLEITETTLMHDTEVTRNRLAELREAGVSLAVDDFGTGYSSLQYVQRFPIDGIKIDRSFVRGLGEEAGDSAVVQSMIELAQRLGVHTVAEGIERPEQITLLQSLGADLGQGYLFSRPVSPHEVEQLLHQSIAEGPRFLVR